MSKVKVGDLVKIDSGDRDRMILAECVRVRQYSSRNKIGNFRVVVDSSARTYCGILRRRLQNVKKVSENGKFVMEMLNVLLSKNLDEKKYRGLDYKVVYTPQKVRVGCQSIPKASALKIANDIISRYGK